MEAVGRRMDGVDARAYPHEGREEAVAPGDGLSAVATVALVLERAEGQRQVVGHVLQHHERGHPDHAPEEGQQHLGAEHRLGEEPLSVAHEKDGRQERQHHEALWSVMRGGQ